MNFTEELNEHVRHTDALAARRHELEHRLRDMSNSVLAGNLQRSERSRLPAERDNVIQQIAEIDAGLEAAELHRQHLNDYHLAATVEKTVPRQTADLQAHRDLETLEQKRETIASVIGSLEARRASVVMAAQLGDKQAAAESSRLAGEIDVAVRDARDIEVALDIARSTVNEAHAHANKADANDRTKKAAELSAEAVALGAEADKHAAALASALEQVSSIHRRIVSLGMLSDINSRRLSNPRVTQAGLIAAGLKKYLPHLTDGLSIKPCPFEESYRQLFPYGRKAKAA